MTKKDSYFEIVDSKVSFPKVEDEILKFWKKEKIFEKSVTDRPESKKWTFLDGPPFITGLPHYGNILSSLPKDLFPRYKTMKGFKVERVWGWDCHGLPIENKVENKLNLKNKKEIEDKVGVKKFIEECKNYVSETSPEWEWYVDHVGRWVDFKNAYRTMDIKYMESVMWVFKKMYEKDFIYKGLRVSLYCPHCQTPISNFEVAMDNDNYKDLNEPATTYKYELEGEKDTYFLAWSTTPWNKIVTPALAVNPKLTYVKVKQGDEYYILAKDTLKNLKERPKHKVVEEFKGNELVGKKFVPHFDYYKKDIKKGKKAFVVIPADFVESEEGTGIVTIAAYGEEDLVVMKKENIHMELHVNDNGVIKDGVPLFGGMYYLKANKLVDENLEKRGLIYKKENLSHKIPHCWRCATRLFHNPQNAWYVDVQKLKPRMKINNEKVNWVPKYFKNGRFLKSMENAPDWCISRSRYWGSPVPIWECTCGERFVPGSISELEEASGEKIADLHKPEIDEVKVKCRKCGKKASRVSEVLDSWIEAGSASFAERHFPFEKGMDESDPGEFFPPDFIIEYTGQIRAWFYVLHVISTAIYDTNAFKNVVVTGVVLGTDGRKMSKNFGNYPDPKKMIQKYGGDALRLYMMGTPVMKGEDILISEEEYRNQVRGYLLPLWNVYNFFVTYANTKRWKPEKKVSIDTTKLETLDKWILSRLDGFLKDIEKGYEEYDTAEIITLAKDFLVKDFSGWYIRRIRGRVAPSNTNKEEKDMVFGVLWTVLTNFVKTMAPTTPFISEYIYQNLTKENSVHLSSWPKLAGSYSNESLEKEMEGGIKVASALHSLRKEKNVAVRIPLRKIIYFAPRELSKKVLKVVMDEVNIEKLVFGKQSNKIKIEGDTSKKNQNEEAGKARRIIREIQVERRNMGTNLSEKVNVSVPSWPEEYKEEIMSKALIEKLSVGEFKVTKLK